MAYTQNPPHADSSAPPAKIGVALAGGGSWGAFTSGALQALIEAGILRSDTIGAISGTSAGAANAAMLSHAANAGDAKKTIPMLKDFWNKVIKKGEDNGLAMMPAALGEKFPNLNSNMLEQGKQTIRLLQAWGIASQPGTLERKIESVLGRDWRAIQQGPIKTYIGTVELSRNSRGQKVMTHKSFENKDITPAVIAASGTLIGTTRIANDYYEDGAYLKNPSMQELENGDVTDIIAIVLYPKPNGPIRPAHENILTPRETAFIGPEVYHHLAWIAQNSKARIHVIDMPHQAHWNETSKMNISSEWISHLYNLGYSRTKDWIAQNGHKIGKTSSFTPLMVTNAPSGSTLGYEAA